MDADNQPQSSVRRSVTRPLTQRQHEGLLLNPKDDWTGTTNQAEMKRRQNRLNQRARRMGLSTQSFYQTWLTKYRKIIGMRHQAKAPDYYNPESVSAATLSANAESSVSSRQNLVSFHGYFMLPTPERKLEAQLIVQKLYTNYKSGAPSLDSLSHLTRLNVLDAFACNAISFGFTIEGLCRDELISPFKQRGPSLLP
jgi:hypothetical protein